MLREFRDFIARGNVLDLAVAVIIGAAFGKITTTLVEGVIMPPIGMALGGMDFSSLFYALDTTKGIPASLADAKTKGVPVIAYGAFNQRRDQLPDYRVRDVPAGQDGESVEGPAGSRRRRADHEGMSEVSLDDPAWRAQVRA